MTSKRAVARHLLRALPPGYANHKGVVYVSQYEHFIQGLLIQHSSSKSSYQLNTLVFPLLFDHGFMHINFSERWMNTSPLFPDDTSLYYFPGTSLQIARQMLDVIAEHNLAPPRDRPYGPADFLAQYGVIKSSYTPSNKLAEIGACAALMNDIPHARWCLDGSREYITGELEYRKGSDSEESWQMQLDQVIAARRVVDKGLPAITDHFRQVSRRVAASLGFPPSTSDVIPA